MANPEQPPPATETPGAIPENQIATPPSSPPLLGGTQVQVLLGPHTGSTLILPTAEADQAIADKWARAGSPGPFDPNAPLPTPLTDEETRTATEAADVWATAQIAPPDEEQRRRKAQETPQQTPPPDKTVTAQPPGVYETRGSSSGGAKKS